MGADTKANNGSGALKIRDLRLLEHGSERRGALVSDEVALKTVREMGGVSGKVAACQRALTERRTQALNLALTHTCACSATRDFSSR